MIRAVLFLVALALPGVAGAAEATLANWLKEGFEIKAAFSDNNGGAYILIQKGTEAYMCHSNPNPRCEKLN